VNTALIGGVQNKVTGKARVGGVGWPAGVASTYPKFGTVSFHQGLLFVAVHGLLFLKLRV
jgi:hypothetical protein